MFLTLTESHETKVSTPVKVGEIIRLNKKLKISLFKANMKKSSSFYILSIETFLVHIVTSRKDKACCSVFVFCKGTSNAICDLVLYLDVHECTLYLVFTWITNSIIIFWILLFDIECDPRIIIWDGHCISRTFQFALIYRSSPRTVQ